MSMAESKFVPVYEARGMLEADTIRIFLESEGITAFISQESAGIALGLTIGPLGLAEILVREEQLDQARKLLEEMEAGSLLSADDELAADEDGGDQPD
jgi:hypothetical protein